ncbi:MAG: T9SS type A sorting domain-containing protein [Bacteroidia bacterium]|nr:T9SS type A sorting domain-containing protein [Bacteroidia bacterium]
MYHTINDGNFTMEFDNDINSKTIELIDVMGKVVFSQNTDREKIELHLELNFGAYFVRISSNQLLSVKKKLCNST